MALSFECSHCSEKLVSKFLKIGEEMKCESCGEVSIIPENAVGISDSKIKKNRTISDAFDKKNSTSDDENKTSKESNVEVANRYPTLMMISGLYNFLAYLSILFGVIYFFISSSGLSDGLSATIVFFSALMIGLGGYVFFKLFSEGIKLFVDIANDVNAIKNKK